MRSHRRVSLRDAHRAGIESEGRRGAPSNRGEPGALKGISTALVLLGTICAFPLRAAVVPGERPLVEVIVEVPEGAPTEIVRERNATPDRLIVRTEKNEEGSVRIRLVNVGDADVRFEVRVDHKNPNGCGFHLDVLHPRWERPVHLRWFDCAAEEKSNAEWDFPPTSKLAGGGGNCLPLCYEITNLPFAPAGAVPDGGGIPGTPLKIAKEHDGRLIMTWGPSCNTSDTDYEIYEGAIGEFEKHAPLVCSTEGNTMRAIDPVRGGRYYIVVPRNDRREGSYGTRSDGSERGQGAPACLVQEAAPCK